MAPCISYAACGGGGDGGGGGANHASNDAPETTTTTATKEQDEAFAKRIVITAADLPPGFAEDKDAVPDDPAAEEDPFDKCVGPQLGAEAEALETAVRAEADSADFEKQDTDQALFVGSSSSVFDTESNAEKAMGLVAGEQFKTCTNEVVKQEIQREVAKDNSSATVTKATVGSLSFGQQGEHTVAFRLDVQFRVARQSLAAPVDVALLRKDRALVILVFGAVGRPFPSAEEQPIASKVVARIQGHAPSRLLGRQQWSNLNIDRFPADAAPPTREAYSYRGGGLPWRRCALPVGEAVVFELTDGAAPHRPRHG